MSHINTDTKPQAQILRFSRRRGRPKSNRPQIDTGTPETIMKRLLGETSEALDLCLERGIIDNKQHISGIHLRWLYTLRHGIPSVRALDLSQKHGYEYNPEYYENDTWRTAREREYNEAIAELTDSGYAIPVLNLCVYNERPRFLKPPHCNLNTVEEIKIIREGLNLLSALWKKRK